MSSLGILELYLSVVDWAEADMKVCLQTIERKMRYRFKKSDNLIKHLKRPNYAQI